MCGRFSLTVGDREIEEEFEVNVSFDRKLRYNIAPIQDALVLLEEEERQLAPYRWGLIPFWAKDAKIGNRLINARAETVFEKPAFRAAARKRRCLVLADGFFEWKKMNDGKVPIYLRLKTRNVFGFAGLWEKWSSPEGEEIRTFTILTTGPNEMVKSIHNRMPVIVPKDLEGIWLDSELQGEDELLPILAPYPADEMESYAVSKTVNSPANDTPECVQPLG